MRFHILGLLLLPFLLVSCGFFPTLTPQTETAPLSSPSETDEIAFVNPFPEGTYEHFTADPSYKKTYNVYRNHTLLSEISPDSSSLQINLSTQRAQLMHNGAIAMDYPVATGKSTHLTPTGEFTILEKIKDKRSNTYGRIYNSSGSVVNSGADARTDEIPAGGKFVGASMPYWMRFTWTGIGHHVGNVPRYPASHGCIRGMKHLMPEIYSKVKVGTPVSIIEG